jgi:hypothetical protein
MTTRNAVTSPSQVIVNQATTLTLTTYLAGTATDVGTITIGITDANGTEVVAAGTAVTDGANGTYTYALALQSAVKVLYVAWTEAGGSSYRHEVEVIGQHLFTEVEVRAFDNAAMANTTTYTDAAILDGERAIGAMLERHVKRSYVRRYCRVELPGSGTSCIDLAHPRAQFRSSTGDDVGGPGRLRDIRRILSADDGASVSTSDIVLDGTKLIRKAGIWTTGTTADPWNVTIEYEYGLSGDDPEGVKRPALWLLRERLVPSDMNARATSYSDSLGTLRFETPGRNGNVSSIPEVNMWVKSQMQDTLVW